jgi:photosynthetic reaction center cytochrome c subunit
MDFRTRIGQLGRSRLVVVGAAFCVVIALSRWVRLEAQPGAPAKTAEQAYKNIKVLKTIPADQLMPSMQFISASLGVECEFCHVSGAFDKDDKKPKQTARKMMEMMFAINKANFEDHREVTCYTCHAGKTSPVGIPAIPDAAAHLEETKATVTKEAKTDDAASSKQAALAVIDKYVAAVGGDAAIRKVTSRVERGSADVGGKQMAIDIYAQAPDKRVSVMHLPNGESVTAYNGSVGWLSVPGRPTHWMSQGEAEAARLDADLHFPARVKEIFGDFKLAPQEKVEGHDVSVVLGLREGKPPVKLYFDQQSGLLVRMLRYADSALGLNPSQIDYADYRDSGGVRIPYQWTIARPSGRFTIKVEDVEANGTIEASRFTAPAPDKP